MRNEAICPCRRRCDDGARRTANRIGGLFAGRRRWVDGGAVSHAAINSIAFAVTRSSSSSYSSSSSSSYSSSSFLLQPTD